MHSSLPGLTRLEQMFLVALADTVATTSAEVASSTDQQYTGLSSLCVFQSYLYVQETVYNITHLTCGINTVFLKKKSEQHPY